MAAGRLAAVLLLCLSVAGCLASSGAAPSTNRNPETGSTGGSGR